MTEGSGSSYSGKDGPDSVELALDMLLEEIESESDGAKRAGADAFLSGDHGGAEASLARSKVLTEFFAKVVALRNEWCKLSMQVRLRGSAKSSSTRRNFGKLPKGLRTPESEFVEPILRVLNEMGGRGRGADVVTRVGQIMQPVLRDSDYETLASDGAPRWIKTAHWTRRRMVIEGLLESDSRRGIWEISGKGRARLKS